MKVGGWIKMDKEIEKIFDMREKRIKKGNRRN
jgi:hypothetical protein